MTWKLVCKFEFAAYATRYYLREAIDNFFKFGNSWWHNVKLIPFASTFSKKFVHFGNLLLSAPVGRQNGMLASSFIPTKKLTCRPQDTRAQRGWHLLLWHDLTFANYTVCVIPRASLWRNRKAQRPAVRWGDGGWDKEALWQSNPATIQSCDGVDLPGAGTIIHGVSSILINRFHLDFEFPIVSLQIWFSLFVYFFIFIILLFYFIEPR